MYTHTVRKAILSHRTGVSLPTIAVGPAVTCHSWPSATLHTRNPAKKRWWRLPMTTMWKSWKSAVCYRGVTSTDGSWSSSAIRSHDLYDCSHRKRKYGPSAIAAIRLTTGRTRRRNSHPNVTYIDSEPSRNSVLSSQTLTSTGLPLRASSRARARPAGTSAMVLIRMPSAPKPAATSW